MSKIPKLLLALGVAGFAGMAQEDPKEVVGFATTEYYLEIPGVAVIDLLDSDKFIDGDFDTTEIIVGIDLLNDYDDDYGTSTAGWIVVPESGEYNLFIRSDDASELHLSDDDTIPDPFFSTPIAEELDCCNPFMEPDTGDLATSLPIDLVAGRKYGFTFLQKEGTGGDFGQVALRKTTDDTPAASLAPIGGLNLVSIADVTGITMEITQQPQDTTVQEEKTATLSVTVLVEDATEDPPPPAWYQWYKDGDLIVGAIDSTYTTPILEVGDSGAEYTVMVGTLGTILDSDEATVTVVPDTFPPVLEGVGALASETGNTMDVGVIYDEPVTSESAGEAGNYSLSPGTIESVTLMENNFDGSQATPGMIVQGVIITASGLSVGETYTLTVSNIEDTKGNVLDSASQAFTVGSMKWGVVGGDQLGAGRGVVAVADNGFDLYSDGVGEWATYDESTFVYEEITGDFERVLRVEFQDNSSQWARAGLIARTVTNFGVDQDAQDNGEAGRYQKVHVNPVGPTMTGPGTDGNNSWEGNRRLDTGGATDSAGSGGTPEYPDAWVRMVREGQTITIFRANGDEEWVELGVTTWPDDATDGEELPETLFVGPEFSPENNNIDNEDDRGIWVARMRDYGERKPEPSEGPDYGIGLNFGADEADGAGTGTLAAADSAGVIAQANWNNLDLFEGANSEIVADVKGSAEATEVTVTWTSNNTWSSTGRGEENNAFTGADRTLMLGYLDTSATSTTTVEVSGLPDEVTADGYDVYVYLLGGVPGKGGGYRILDTDSGAELKATVLAEAPENPDNYVEAVPEGDAAGLGTYILFCGLASPNITVVASTDGGLGFGDNPRAPINAIQLVTPASCPVEPPAPRFTAITLNGDGTVTIEWTGGGVLEAAESVTGPWEEVEGATSPFTVDADQAMMYARLRE